VNVVDVTADALADVEALARLAVDADVGGADDV
jgi:hypothetical protein